MLVDRNENPVWPRAQATSSSDLPPYNEMGHSVRVCYIADGYRDIGIYGVVQWSLDSILLVLELDSCRDIGQLDCDSG